MYKKRKKRSKNKAGGCFGVDAGTHLFTVNPLDIIPFCTIKPPVNICSCWVGTTALVELRDT